MSLMKTRLPWGGVSAVGLWGLGVRFDGPFFGGEAQGLVYRETSTVAITMLSHPKLRFI